MESIALAAPKRKLVVGVDTHKHLHVAVALDELGARVGELTIGADSIGYAALASWSEQLGRPCAFGIEGTGSYGAGLASFCAGAAAGSSRSTAATGAAAGRTANRTRLMPRQPHALCSRALPQRSRRAPTVSAR